MNTSPEAERAVIRAGGTASDVDTRRFYGQRVADYAFVLTVMFGGVYVLGWILLSVGLPERVVQIHAHPTKLAHLGWTVACATVWRLACRPDCPPWLITAGDILLPVGVATVTGLVSASAPAGYGLIFVPLLVVVMVLVLRAAFIPSSPARTALVGLMSAVPIVIASRIIALHDPGLPDPLSPSFVTLGALGWCMAIVAATTLVSRAIYGLHNEVRSAKRLGQYALGELIGQGGMGAVYRAEHAMLRRPTAVKLLHPERAGRESIARFEREVQLTARLTHPNTVAVYDYGRTPDGHFYYAMEFLDGVSLEELVRRFGPQPAARVIQILLQAAGALSEAHALGLIHRDVKPANVLFCERGGLPDVVKLVDFGLVKSLEPEQGPALTQTNAITGTPLFMAPESITDPAGVDHRVDLYALGGIGYFLLTGRPPFEGQSVLEICGHHLHTVPERPSRLVAAVIPEELEALIMSCLAKKPEDRPHGAQELHDALAECARRWPWSLAEARAWWREFRGRADQAGALPDDGG